MTNLPPGVNANDIPGNDTRKWDRACEHATFICQKAIPKLFTETYVSVIMNETQVRHGILTFGQGESLVAAIAEAILEIEDIAYRAGHQQGEAEMALEMGRQLGLPNRTGVSS